MTPAALRAHIRQLCCLGVRSEQLMPPLLKAIRQLVGADSAGFFWVDAQGDMTNLYADRVLPAPVARLYFDRYYDSSEASFKREFAQRARQPEAVIAVTPSADVERTPYYNDVLRRLDAHHVLYGTVRQQTRALGQVSLYRPKAARPFSASARADLASIMGYVAHGVAQRAPGADADFVDTQDDALFLVRQGGAIEQISTEAEKLLGWATMAQLRRAGGTDLHATARPALQLLVQRLRDAQSGVDTKPPALQLDTTWGRFILRAYALGDEPFERDSCIAVRIQRQEPMLLRFVDALNGLALSPQQREVALGLARGLSNRDLAHALGLSANTVAYHVKQLFAKLDAHDRRQMMGNVIGGTARMPAHRP